MTLIKKGNAFARIQRRLAVKRPQHRERQLLPVAHEAAQAPWMEQRPHRVRASAVVWPRPGEEPEDPVGAAVAPQDVPGAVNHERWIGFLLPKMKSSA